MARTGSSLGVTPSHCGLPAPLVGWASWNKARRPEGCELGWEYQSTSRANPDADPIPAVSCLSGPGSPLPGGRSSSCRLPCLGHTGLLPIRVLNLQHQNSLSRVTSPGSSALGTLANCCAQRGLHPHLILILTVSLQAGKRPPGEALLSFSDPGSSPPTPGLPHPKLFIFPCHCFSAHAGFRSF